MNLSNHASSQGLLLTALMPMPATIRQTKVQRIFHQDSMGFDTETRKYKFLAKINVHH
jgi:hypothetical protein